MAAGRKALVVATYDYADGGLSRLAAPAHDAESFASVLQDPAIAGFDVTMLVNKPHYVVGEAIADFYADSRRDDLTLLYFTGHGVKDDEGRLYLAMTNTRREALMFTAISAAQLNDAMDASTSRRKVLILDCCYSGAFPAGRTAKSDEGVQTLERFQGKGRAVLTASDATQYAFEGDDLRGSGTSSVFTRHLVEAISSGAADLDEDGDIALDELYSYVYEQVIAEVPQQRPKKQEDVDGRILIARNVHWMLPAYLRHAIESPIAAQRLSAMPELEHLHQAGNDIVRAAVVEQLTGLATDDSRSVAAAAGALLDRVRGGTTTEEAPVPPPRPPVEAVSPAPTPVSAPPTPVSASLPTPVRAAAVVPTTEPEPVPWSPQPAPPSPAIVLPPPSEPRNREQVTTAPPIAVILALLVIGGVLLLVSRFVVFDSVNGSRAADVGLYTVAWTLGVALPLVAALQMFIVWSSTPWAGPLAAGLVTGAILSQLDQALGTSAFFLNPDAEEAPGLGWWLALVGTAALIACVAVAGRAVFGGPLQIRRDWRAVVATLVVVAALVAWLRAFTDYWVWFAAVEPGLLLALACLPLAAFTMSASQRLLGLAAVTVYGAWLAVFPLEQLATESILHTVTATVTVLVCVLASVGVCYLAQVPAPRRR